MKAEAIAAALVLRSSWEVHVLSDYSAIVLQYHVVELGISGARKIGAKVHCFRFVFSSSSVFSRLA